MSVINRIAEDCLAMSRQLVMAPVQPEELIINFRGSSAKIPPEVRWSASVPRLPSRRRRSYGYGNDPERALQNLHRQLRDLGATTPVPDYEMRRS
jgi:hypothetical protein